MGCGVEWKRCVGGVSAPRVGLALSVDPLHPVIQVPDEVSGIIHCKASFEDTAAARPAKGVLKSTSAQGGGWGKSGSVSANVGFYEG